MSHISRFARVFAVLALSAVNHWVDAAPAATVPVAFNIEPQTLREALTAFANQAGLQLLFDVKEVAPSDTRAPKLVGTFTPEAALDKLLASTGLVYRFVNTNTVIIRAETAAGNESAGRALEQTSNTALTLADVGDPQSATQHNQDKQRTEMEPIPAAQDQRDQEVVVTGSHIKGAQDIAVPVRVFTREDIEQGGYSDIQGLFRDLPGNLSDISTGASQASGVSATAGLNTQGVSGVNLRGLGAESTLVLLNGRRMPANVFGQVADVSAIPLSAVDRVEVVTGGRSAVYGSDAVAGVVNIVTRRAFTGSETSALYGFGTGEGGERLQLSEVLGKEAERYGILLAYDYLRDSPLNAIDTGVVPASSPTSRFDIIAASHRHSGVLSGHLDLSGNIRLYADGIYTRSTNRTGQAGVSFGVNSTSTVNTTNEQHSGTLGVEFGLGRAWHGDVAATFGSLFSEQFFGSAGTILPSGPSFSSAGENSAKGRQNQISAIFDGTLLTLDRGEVKAAFGAEYRLEEFQRLHTSPTLKTPFKDRTVRSAFGEILIPLVEQGATAMLNRLDLSAAGRYDRYSDFGKTFNPQFGMIWQPVKGLVLRGAYSKAFRAPSLFNLASPEILSLFPLADPAASPPGSSPTLRRFNGNPTLDPERAKTWSLTADVQPAFAPWATASATYYEIKYRDRIDVPATGNEQLSVLQNSSRYPEFINRAPTPAELASLLAGAGLFVNSTGTPFNPATQSLLTVFPNLVVFDNRYNNTSIESVDGIDLNFRGVFPIGNSTLSFGTSAAYTFSHERQVTSTSPAVSTIDRPGRPVDFQIRGNVGWERGGWGSFAYLNYTDNYRDTVASPNRNIASWTTLDLVLRFEGSKLPASSPFGNATVTLNIDNLFDRKPPSFLNDPLQLGFDPVNADPFGRRISIQLRKRL